MPESSEPPKLYPDLELAADIHRALCGAGDVEKVKAALVENNAFKMWDSVAEMGLKLGSKSNVSVALRTGLLMDAGPLFFFPHSPTHYHITTPTPQHLQDLEKKAGEEIKALDEKLAAAKESGGETEIQEIQFSKANVLAKHGDFEGSNAIYAEIKAEKKVSSGKKIEAGFGEARNMLFANEGIGKLMEEVAEYCKLGGDWDKRNRHAAYLALHNLRDREIEKAADSMKAGVKTFNAEEVISFKEVRRGRTSAHHDDMNRM